MAPLQWEQRCAPTDRPGAVIGEHLLLAVIVSSRTAAVQKPDFNVG